MVALETPRRSNLLLGSWLVVGSSIILLALWQGVVGYILLAGIGIWGWVLLMKRTELWLSAVLILYGITFMSWSPEVTIVEIFASFFFIVSVSLWFLSETIVYRKKIFRSYDVSFILLLSLVGISIIQAVCFSTSLLLWARECSTFALMLLYLPLRQVLKDPLKRKIVIAAFLVVIVMLSIAGILHYRERIQEALGLGTSLFSVRLYFGLPFPFMIYYGLMIASTSEQWSSRISGFLLSFFCSVMVFISLGRTYWLVSAIGIVMMLFGLQRKDSKRLAVIVICQLAIGSCIIIAAYATSPMARIFFDQVMNRLSLTGAGIADPAVSARLIESTSGVRAFFQNPIIGYGMGSSFTIFEAVEGFHKQALYFHNGYLWILVKLGVIGLLVMITYYCVRLYHGWLLIRSRILDRVHQGYAVVAMVAIVSMLVAAFTEMCFMIKDVLMFAMLAIAILDWLWEEKNNGEKIAAEVRDVV